NHSVFVDVAFFLGIFDHGQADAILDAGAGIKALGFHPHFDIAGKEFVDFDAGGVADGFEDIVVFHGTSPFVTMSLCHYLSWAINSLAWLMACCIWLISRLTSASMVRNSPFNEAIAWALRLCFK